ncbi:exocyst complex component 8, partial [Phenoliferia sp. Uapishka_3]
MSRNGDTSLRTQAGGGGAPDRFPPTSQPRQQQSNINPARSAPGPPDGRRAGGQIRGGPPPSASSGASHGTPRQQSNVGARLLKKRQSVSYNAAIAGGISLPVGVVPGVPSLPTVIPPPLPSGVSAGTGSLGQRMDPSVKQRSRSPSPAPQVGEGSLASLGVDVEALSAESFRPEDFLKQSLAGGRTTSQMEDLRGLKGRLEAAMKMTEVDLQRSVFKNYADFVVISKEISTLENEMLELKSVLEEWRAVPESLEGGWGVDDLLIGGSSGPNRRTQRNSLADLATLYKSQLSALWEGVEGSQKLLPYVPGRHLISESASFIELNSATYKPKQHVHLFLLNDTMLVSVKKRRGTAVGGKVRLVAERCFNLSEIVVVDLKDGGDLTNAVKIKRGKETIIFRTDKSEDKKVLLMAFKKVAEELMNKKRKEMLSEAEARKGDPGTLRSARFDYDGSLPSSGFSPTEMLGFGKDDPTGKDLSWIGDYSDELSVSIAMRMFEEAVVLVEKGKTIIPHLVEDPHASVMFREKLDQRSTELVSALLQDLSDHSIRKSGVIRTTSWLLRLGQGEKARETFLAGRGTLVRKRARQIKFEGDISMYISELAMVCFTLIKNSCEWYMAAFKDNRMASGFVRWASEQVEIYAEMFRRQVYGADQDGNVIAESLEVTKAHGAMACPYIPAVPSRAC